ncbi:MAG TPA: DUF5317 domain-containing protein [Chloroflexota bacterium]|nr:DUF5317 domain-containing protein [Chloroflexota bacterium]
MAALPLRLGWLALLALAAQIYVIYYPGDGVEAARGLHAILMMGSYLALGIVVAFNSRVKGMSIIGLGLLLNFLVMAANGGFMPVSREAILTTGTRVSDGLPSEGMRLPRSKDVLLSAENTRLWMLSDTIMAPRMPLARVYSIGDLIVGLGIIFLIQAAMLPGRHPEALEEGMQATQMFS